MRPTTFQFGNLRLQGWSEAGSETWFRVHPPGLALDAGRGAPQLAGAADVFLTHGHLDHALGAAYVLSQRTRHQGAGTRVFAPAEVLADLEAMVRAAGRMERTEYDVELIGLAAGDRVPVGRGLVIEAFATDHVVPSLGYHLVRVKHRLRERYRGLPGAELARLKAGGEETEEPVEELALTYCGDTGPGVFEIEPRLFDAGVLVLECTFLGAAKRENAALYKHLHVEDLAERRERFRNRALVLHHLSRRHRVTDLRREVETRMPELADRIHIVGEGDPER
jgi:ribonuclease Z